MVGSGWNFRFCGLKKLLIPLIDEAGDFTANLDARLGKKTRSAIIGPFNGRRNAHFLEEDAVFRAWSVKDVKSVITKPAHGFFISAFLCRCRHRLPDSIPNTVPLFPPESRANRYCRTLTAL